MTCQAGVDDDDGRERKRSLQRRRQWSNLPEDILRLVVEGLYRVDRIRFRAVCKNWLATPIDDIPAMDKLPWLMYYSFSGHHVLCCFFDPNSSKRPYVMEEERSWDDERGWIRAGSFLFRATACASRCGWILFSEKVKTVVNSCDLRDVYYYYVYNPFTRDIISLPGLEMRRHWSDLGCFATFTSDPTSSDCLFIAPFVTDEGRYWVISTYSSNNKSSSWKTHHNIPPVHAVSYMGENVYCYNRWLGLSIFHIATQEWEFLFNTESPFSMMDYEDRDYYQMEPCGSMYWADYFVSYDGNLLVVSLEKVEINKLPECNIFKYDWLDGAWKRLDSLEGGVLFLGNPSFGVSAGDQTKMVANRVYYFSSHTSTPKPMFLVYRPPNHEFSIGNQTYYYGDQISRNLLGQSSTTGNWMWM